MGFIDTEGDAEDVSIMEKDAKMYAVVADYKRGIKIIEITNIKNPVPISRLNSGG